MTGRVVVLQRVLPHYRVAFFEALRVRLAEGGVDLVLVHGQPEFAEAAKNDAAELAWARQIRNRYLRLGRKTLCWQPALGAARGADLVIAEQAGRLLVNNVFILWRRLGGPKFGFWGHGRNLDQVRSSRFAEFLKRRTLRSTDAWFAYTTETAKMLADAGVPVDRITAVQNSSDTRALRADAQSITEDDVRSVRAELGLEKGRVVLVLGSLYESKRLPFVVDVLDELRASGQLVHTIVVGDGPLQGLLEEATSSRPWMHFVGVQTGKALARYAAVADLMLNPGVVGLSALDSFALGLPIVTIRLPHHGPEFAYLRADENAVVLPEAATPREVASVVRGLLDDEDSLNRLRLGCEAASENYSVEAMAGRFAAGIVRALR